MDLERELALHRAATLRAIESGRVDLAERRLKAYVDFAEAFLEAAAKEGFRFSPEVARSISFLDWPTATQIVKDAYNSIMAAVKSDNRELMLSAAYFPLKFMYMSVRKKDFLFYRRMIRIYPSILAVSYSPNSASTRTVLVDRSWRYLKEFANYSLIKLTEDYEEDILRQFVSAVLWTFSDLMKVALDHNDPATFGLLGRELNALFDHHHGVPDSEVSPLSNLVNAERSIIWFGFGAWLMRSHVMRNATQSPGLPDLKLVSAPLISTFFEVVANNFHDIRLLSTVYMTAYQRDLEESNWEEWLLETLPEGEAHFIDSQKWLTYFYTVQGLRLSRTDTTVASDIPVPHRELQYRMGVIRTITEQIRENPGEWVTLIPLLSESAAQGSGGRTDMVRYFLRGNEIAVDEWQRMRANEVIAAPMDESRVVLFREQCNKGWLAQSWAPQLFTDFGRKEERVAEPSATYLAIHHLLPKEAFVANRDAEYVGFGHDEGAQIGRDITKHLLKQLEGASTKVGSVSMDTVVERTCNLACEMSAAASKPIVILFGDFELQNRFLTDQRFIAKWRAPSTKVDTQAYFGELQGVPVFSQLGEKEQRVLVVGLQEIGKLVWYLPLTDNYHGLLIRVKPIDEKTASDLADRQSQRLQTADGKMREKKDVVREFLQQVEVFVGAKLELNIEQPDKARVIPIRT